MNLALGVQVVSTGLLSLMVIGAALGVVLLQNIVYSAFLLGVVLISMGGLYLLLNADFVAAAQILVYVGAVNVLIIYAIMLVNKQEVFVLMPRRWVRKGGTALVCSGLFALLSIMVLQTSWSTSTGGATPTSSTVVIGEHFFSDFLLPFEIASVLLLMALIGAVVLARRELLPEGEVLSQGQVMQALPERPRETVALSSSRTGSPESTVESVRITRPRD